jgi:hypothetical protein
LLTRIVPAQVTVRSNAIAKAKACAPLILFLIESRRGIGLQCFWPTAQRQAQDLRRPAGAAASRRRQTWRGSSPPRRAIVETGHGWIFVGKHRKQQENFACF